MGIRVTKTFDHEHWLSFDEADVRKACALAGCNEEMIEGCLENMREGEQDSITCYVYLINEIGAVPSYLKARKTICKSDRLYLVLIWLRRFLKTERRRREEL